MASSDVEAPKRVFFHTFGCQMNEVDTGSMRARLVNEGWTPVATADQADLILVNTCSVRELAVEKMHSALGEYRRMKKERGGVIIGIAGCVAQERGAELLKKYPDVDLAFGPDGVPHVEKLIAQARAGVRVLDTDFLDLDHYPFATDLDPAHSGVTAYVTIQKGCDNRCTFCIVPTTRGAEASRSADEIVAEVRALVARGVRDVTLIGQNVNSYGLKRAGEVTFSRLLYRVAEVPGLARVRYTTSHPRDMGEDVVEAYRDLEKLASHLHLPVQSGSDRVLKRMKRYYTRDHYLKVIAAIREVRPDLVLTTDIIVGFPGETDDDFEQTMTLVEDAGFVGAFSFKYSPRPGTPALKLKDDVPAEVASARLTRLQHRLREKSSGWYRGLEGQVVDVLVEGPSRHDVGVICGRTSGFAMVNFPGDVSLVGQPVRVAVTRGFTNSCRGEHVA